LILRRTRRGYVARRKRPPLHIPGPRHEIPRNAGPLLRPHDLPPALARGSAGRSRRAPLHAPDPPAITLPGPVAAVP
jgi:hypothetical protein